jgi:undecaprenyl-diphosphatase
VRILDPGLVPNDSYPSGHVGTAIAVYGGTALLVWWFAPRTRPWIWLLALVPVIVALSRLYEGAHHVTDVLTSMCYATAWLAVATAVLRSQRQATAPTHNS